MNPALAGKEGENNNVNPPDDAGYDAFPCNNGNSKKNKEQKIVS